MMNHFYFFLPSNFLNWLILGFSFIFIAFMYFLGNKKWGKKDISFKNLWCIMICGFAVLLGVLVELLLFKDFPFYSTAYDISLIFRILLIGLPILFCANYLPFKKGFIGLLFTSLIYSLTITHSLFTIVEVLGIFILAHFAFDQFHRKALFEHVIRTLYLGLLITPFTFFMSLIYYPSSLIVRFDYAFTVGWNRWLAYLISLLLATILLWAADKYFLSKANQTVDASTHAVIDKSSSRSIIILFIISLFLMTSSAYWYFQRVSLYQKIEDGLNSLSPSFTLDYEYFYDMGKALIQSYSDEIVSKEQNTYLVTLSQMVNRNPFFSTIAVVDSTSVIVQYPPDAYDFDSQQISILCNDQRSPDAMVNLKNDDLQTIYLFSSKFDAEQCLVGLTSIKFSPQLNQYINLFDNFSTYWYMQDSFGAKYISNIEVLSTVQDGGIPQQSYLDGFQLSFHEFGKGPLAVNLFFDIELEDIPLSIIGNGWKPLLIVAVVYCVLLIVLLVLNAQIQEKLIATFEGLSALQNYEFNEIMAFDSGTHWLGLNQKIQQLGSSMALQTAYLQKGLDVIDAVNSAKSLVEINSILRTEPFLNEIGSMNLIFDPDLKLSQQHASYINFQSSYQNLVKHAIGNDYLPFILQLSNGNSEGKPIQTTFYPLRYRSKLIGFLMVNTNQEMKTHQARFLSSFANLLTGTLSHRLRQILDNIENDRINFLIQAYPEPIFLADRNSNLYILNDAAKKLPGVDQNRAVTGTPFRQFIRETNLLLALEKACRDDIYGTRIILPNRHEYLLTVVSNGETASNIDEWLLIVLQDVTQYKENVQVRTELVDSVAQYLQLPIKMTRGNLRMLGVVGPLNDLQKSYSSRMEASITDIDSYIQNMIDRNKLENPANFALQIMDLDQLLQDVVNRILPYASQQKVLIYREKNNGDAPRQIECDSQLLTQAFYNLIKNAVQYNHTGGEVQLNVDEDGADYLICISDTGVGISAVDINRIFKDSPVLELNRKSSHTSLGLPLVKSIIERHQGEIWVKSKLGKGSQFFVRIPKYFPSRMRK